MLFSDKSTIIFTCDIPIGLRSARVELTKSGWIARLGPSHPDPCSHWLGFGMGLDPRFEGSSMKPSKENVNDAREKGMKLSRPFWKLGDTG